MNSLQEISSHISGPDTERLLAVYRTCTPDERRILALLSVICQPVTQAAMEKVLHQLGWRGTDGEPLSESLSREPLRRLSETGLVLRERNLLRCHPDILEVPARELATAGAFGDVAAAVYQVIPPSTSPLDSWSVTELAGLCGLRSALYEGRTRELLRLWGLDKEPLEPADYHRAAKLIRVCMRPFDAAWFARLDPEIRFRVLASLLAWCARFLQPDELAYRLFEDDFPSLAGIHRGAPLVLIEQRLHRGRVEEAAALLAEHATGDATGCAIGDAIGHALALTGWLRFIEGEYGKAIAAFESALASRRGEQRRRKVHLRGMPGILYILALMHRGQRGDLETAREQIWIATKAKPGDSFESVRCLLEDTIGVLLGTLGKDQGSWLKREAVSMDPYLELFRCLALHWTGAGPRSRDAAKLLRFCQAAHEGGYRWYEEQSAALLALLGKPAACRETHGEAAAAPRFPSLVDLIEPRQDWQLILTALKQVPGAQATADGDATEPDRRLVWQVACDAGSCHLVPWEQKRSKHGAWSRGRPVALQRLAEQRDKLPFLSPEDRRICGHILAEVTHGYGGRQRRVSYRLDEDKAPLAAVGHPLLFRADAPKVAVELVVEAPVLLVRRGEDELDLRLEPPPVAGRTLIARQDAGDRIRLIAFENAHLRIAEILGPEGVTVPLAAEKEVVESIGAVAPLLSVHSDIGGGTEEHAGVESVPADPRPRLHLQPAGEGLRLELLVQPLPQGGPLFHPGEGAATLFAEVAGRPLKTRRDLAAERHAADQVLAQCPRLERDEAEDAWDWTLEDAEGALETLAALKEMGDAVVLEWPQGRKIRLTPKAAPAQMKLAVRRQRDWFSIDGALTLDDGRLVPTKQLLELIAASPGRFVRLGEDDYLQLSQELRARLAALSGLSDRGRFHRLTAAAIEQAIGDIPTEAAQDWHEQLARLAAAQALEPAVPSTLAAELRDYQVEGFRWLARLAEVGAGACLADDMGLGKTLQALALILTRAPEGPTLVLAPTSVCANWLEQARRFAPTLRPRRFGAGDRTSMLAEAGPFDLVVASYGLLQTETDRLAAVHWRTLVADEAQAIKNALTRRSRAAMALDADFRMITTGTPIENHLGELWNLFRFLNPGLLSSLERFRQRFAIPIEERKDEDARRRLKQLIRPFILRRLKSDVLSELPPRTEITLRVEPSAAEAALYEALRHQALERLAAPELQPGQQRIRMLAEIMRLRRACCHPQLVVPESGVPGAKLQAFGEILDELLDNRHKALVFSQFVDHLKVIRDYLDARDLAYQYLDGATPARRRQQAVDAFQAGQGALFLISLRAGGVGLNLTAADYVIHMDPWWNPAVEDQASDRAHRIGQERPVTVYRLVMRGTIEEKILDLHRQKRDLADSLLEGTDAGVRLSVDEMLELIRDEGPEDAYG